MKGIICVGLLLALSSPMLADVKPFQVYPTGTDQWAYALAQETLSVVTIAGNPYADFVLFGVVDSMVSGGRCTTNVAVQYRWRVSNPKWPSTYYYGSWEFAFPACSLRTPQTLNVGYLFGCDTLSNNSWPFADIQIRAYGAKDNDSTKFRIWGVKRGYR